MTELSRLSPDNIQDDLYRAMLYKEIRDGQNGDEWNIYEVEPIDVLRPELIAYKVYGLAEMKWLILVASGVDDMREAIEVDSLRLPDLAWVRKRIKYYASLEIRS